MEWQHQLLHRFGVDQITLAFEVISFPNLSLIEWHEVILCWSLVQFCSSSSILFFPSGYRKWRFNDFCWSAFIQDAIIRTSLELRKFHIKLCYSKYHLGVVISWSSLMFLLPYQSRNSLFRRWRFSCIIEWHSATLWYLVLLQTRVTP